MRDKIALRSFLLLISKTVPLLVQMIIIFVYSRQLSLDEYGQYQSLWLFVNVLSVIGLFGLPTLLLSHSTNGILNWRKQNKTTFLIAFSIVTILPPLLFFLFTKEQGTITKMLLIGLVFVQNISILFETISIKLEREKRVVFTNILFAVGFLGWHLAVLYTGYSLDKVLVGLVFLQLGKSILLFPFRNKTENIKPEKEDLLYTGKQWLYLGFNDLLGMLFKWLDKWVILLIVTSAEFAIYFNGSYEIPIFGLLLSAVGSILIVELSKYKEDFSAKFGAINKGTTLLLSAIIFPAFAFLLFYHESFFTLLFSKKYEASIPFFLISIFILPARATYSTGALQVLNRSDIITKGAILDILLAIIFMISLYPIMGAKGIVLAFVLSTYIQLGFYIWQTSRLTKSHFSSFLPIPILLKFMSISLLFMGIIRYGISYLEIPSIWQLFAGVFCTFVLISIFLYKEIVKQKVIN